MTATRLGTRERTDVASLLDAACTEFAEKGYHQATMATIAERAGSTRPTLYAHLRSKPEAHRTVLERESTRCREWLFERYLAAAELPLQEQVTAAVQAFFDYAARYPSGFQLLFGSDNNGETLAVQRELLGAICARIAEMLETFQVRDGRRPHKANPQLAETLVAIAVTGAQYATRTHTSLAQASRTASRLCIGAVTNI